MDVKHVHILIKPARKLVHERWVCFWGIDIGQQQVRRVDDRSESLREDITLGDQFAFRGCPAVNTLDDFIELDPSVFSGGLVSSNGHDEGNETILASARNRGVVHKRLTEGNCFRHIRLIVTGKEEIEGHISISSKVCEKKIMRS
jgi:hypothetical protein